MANHKSAIKRYKQNDKRREGNQSHKSRMRTFVKKFRAAVESGDVEVARTALAASLKIIEQTKSRGVIHGNTASRLVSRLTLTFNKLNRPSAA